MPLLSLEKHIESKLRMKVLPFPNGFGEERAGNEAAYEIFDDKVVYSMLNDRTDLSDDGNQVARMITRNESDDLCLGYRYFELRTHRSHPTEIKSGDYRFVEIMFSWTENGLLPTKNGERRHNCCPLNILMKFQEVIQSDCECCSGPQVTIEASALNELRSFLKANGLGGDEFLYGLLAEKTHQPRAAITITGLN